MSREIIVDMQSPTPFDEYRYKVESNVEIFISRDMASRKYILEIKENGESKAKIESKTILQNWTLIEMIRENSYRENKRVEVHKVEKGVSYKKITLATTLDGRERGEALEKQVQREKSFSRKMVVGTPYMSRKHRQYDPKILRPILREDKTW
jgi:hypothetical protein